MLVLTKLIHDSCFTVLFSAIILWEIVVLAESISNPDVLEERTYQNTVATWIYPNDEVKRESMETDISISMEVAPNVHLMNGEVLFCGKNGKAINKNDVLTFSRRGDALLSVLGVVVEIPQDGLSDAEMARRGFMESLKIRHYKQRILSNPEGEWHIEGSNKVRFYVIKRYKFDKDDVYVVDLEEYLNGSYMDGKPLVMKEVNSRYYPKQIQLDRRFVDQAIKEVFEDMEHAKLCQKAYEAAYNFSPNDSYYFSPNDYFAGKQAQTGNDKYQEEEPELFPELKYLKSNRENPHAKSMEKVVSVSINYSKLEELYKKQISFVRELIEKGKPATQSQKSYFNQLNKEIVNEFNNLSRHINRQIENMQVSDYEKIYQSVVKQRQSSKIDLLNHQLLKLIQEASAKGLGHFYPQRIIDDSSSSFPKTMPRDSKNWTISPKLR